MGLTADQLVELGTKLVEEAEQHGILLRLLGGVAIYVNSPRSSRLPELARAYKDLDFAVNRKGAGFLTRIFQDQGWHPDAFFNARHGESRLLFFYNEMIQADIFIGAFEQVHTFELEKRLKLSSPTLPISDLLLTKLQIRQLNTKDVQDILALLMDHDFGLESPVEHPELEHLLELTTHHWGWYTTVHDNLIAIGPLCAEILNGDNLQLAEARLSALRQAMEAAPKSTRWKLRDKIGRAVPWYDEPEEVNR